jgi:MraZ protein
VEVFTLDSNGRFIIPKRFVEAAKIENEVAFIGMDDRIEVWSKEIVNAPFMSAADFETALQEIMSPEL